MCAIGVHVEAAVTRQKGQKEAGRGDSGRYICKFYLMKEQI